MNSDVPRGQGTKIRTAFASFAASAAVAGAAAGLALGGIGSLLPVAVRVAAATLAGLFAFAVAAYEVTGRPAPLLQCDRETPRRWVERGPIGWGVRNGVALGLGALSRIGFPLWYAVPAGCLLLGSPLWGAGVYATYAGVRAAAIGPMLLFARRRDFDALTVRLLGHREDARVGTALALAALAAAVVAAVGP